MNCRSAQEGTLYRVHRAMPAHGWGRAGRSVRCRGISPVPAGCILSRHVRLPEAPPLRPPSPHGAGPDQRGPQHQAQARQHCSCQANSQQHPCKLGATWLPLRTSPGCRGPGEHHFVLASMSLGPLASQALVKQSSFLPWGLYDVSGPMGGLLHPAPLM